MMWGGKVCSGLVRVSRCGGHVGRVVGSQFGSGGRNLGICGGETTVTLSGRWGSSSAGGGESDVLKPKKINPQRRSKGIVPLGEDYGGYDEDKHEEYEQKAEEHQKRIRWVKKVGSTVVFSTILGTVVWARNKKQRAVEENTKNVVFLPKDPLITGTFINSLCVAKSPDGLDKTVLPASIVQDGTIRFIQEEMQIRSGDVIVASFPKTGVTWVQEIVYVLKNNLNFTKAKSSNLEDRFPFLEYPYPGAKSIDKSPSPRLIKTHLPYGFLPSNVDQGKIIYVVRNPKDTVVSYYHFARMFTILGFQGTFDEFKERFMTDKMLFCPFFGHMESYLRREEDPTILVISYEELSSDPVRIIQKIAHFLETPVTREDAAKVAEHTTFNKMSENPAVNYSHWDELGLRNKNEAPFMRKGKVGDWENYFKRNDDEFDRWIKENNRLKFKFEYYPV